MWKRISLAVLSGAVLGLLGIYWHLGLIDTMLRLMFFVIAFGIPLSLILFLWAWLPRRRSL